MSVTRELPTLLSKRGFLGLAVFGIFLPNPGQTLASIRLFAVAG